MPPPNRPGSSHAHHGSRASTNPPEPAGVQRRGPGRRRRDEKPLTVEEKRAKAALAKQQQRSRRRDPPIPPTASSSTLTREDAAPRTPPSHREADSVQQEAPSKREPHGDGASPARPSPSSTPGKRKLRARSRPEQQPSTPASASKLRDIRRRSSSDTEPESDVQISPSKKKRPNAAPDHDPFGPLPLNLKSSQKVTAVRIPYRPGPVPLTVPAVSAPPVTSTRPLDGSSSRPMLTPVNIGGGSPALCMSTAVNIDARSPAQRMLTPVNVDDGSPAPRMSTLVNIDTRTKASLRLSADHRGSTTPDPPGSVSADPMMWRVDHPSTPASPPGSPSSPPGDPGVRDERESSSSDYHPESDSEGDKAARSRPRRQRQPPSPSVIRDWKLKAQDILMRAYDVDCSVGPSPQTPAKSMAQLNAYWADLLPPPATPSPEPLATDGLFYLRPYITQDLLSDGEKHRLNTAGVWKAVLAGCAERERPVKLSIEQSQQDYLCSGDAKTLRIERTCDVDSFLARVISPAVYKGDFTLCLKPVFGSQWTQDARVTFRDCKVHSLKQLRLGWGSLARGAGFTLHVFFPNMEVKRSSTAQESLIRQRSSFDLTRMLTEAQQGRWLDEVVLPALAASCPSYIRHHLPTSGADVMAKAKVKKEKFSTGQDGDLDLHYTIPEQYCADFWTCVLTKAQDPSMKEFNDLLFVVVAHDLKLQTIKDTPLQARNRFHDLLHQCFHYSDELFPPEDQWLDFGHEDTPVDRPGEGITLLRRRPCLEHWAKRFDCPQALGPTRSTVQYWNWAMTRDAGTANVELGGGNILRQHGGLAFFKAYNINKNLFSTPLKGYLPFDNPHFETLAFSDHLRQEWYRINAGQGSSTSQADVLQSFLRTKQRIHAAFVGPCSTTGTGTRNFGVRQEYRINIRTFRDLPLDDDQFSLQPADDSNSSVQMIRSPPSTSTSTSSYSRLTHWANQLWRTLHPSARATHHPFWILRTSDVMEFAARELGRWILAIEALIYSSASPTSEADQLLHSTTAQTFIRSLRLSLSGLNAQQTPSLWRSVLKSPRSRRRRGPALEESEEEGEEKKKRGLGYRACLDDCGMMWLPPKTYTWIPYPCLTPESYRTLGLPGNAIQHSLKGGGTVERQIRQMNALHRYFQGRLHGSSNPALDPDEQDICRKNALRLGAEIVVAALVCDIFDLLARSQFEVRSPAQWQIERTVGSLTVEEATGLRGLSYDMLSKVLSQPPRVSRVLKPTEQMTNRNKTQKVFAPYNTGRWEDKVFGLFAWHPTTDKAPGWLRYRFRRLQETFAAIIRVEIDGDAVHHFEQEVKRTAAHHLWIIPQYNTSTLANRWKRRPQRSTETAATTANLSDNNRINWHIPCFPFPEEIETESDLSDTDSEDDMAPRQRSALKRICQPTLRTLSVQDHKDVDGDPSDSDPTPGIRIPKDPSEFNLSFRLNLAAEAFREISQD